MKHIANIISIIRIVLLLALFFSFHHALLFLILYLICGFTDILDGYIARKMKIESEMGARLDSFADLLLFAAITISVLLWVGNDIFIYLPWIIVTAFIRCANIAIATYKYHSFAILHTWGNKLTGFLVFITPIFLLYEQLAILWPVCIIAVLSAVEETLIHITSQNLNLNRHSFFIR